ncbi:MAG: hypothetical protein WAM14_13930 [Candidatus Nitrosopolaris sp.]
MKTIQPIGEIVPRDLGGVRFTQRYEKQLINSINDDMENAKEQVQEKGLLIDAISISNRSSRI